MLGPSANVFLAAAVAFLLTRGGEVLVRRPQTGALPASHLAIQLDGAWREFWSAASAPLAWSAPDSLVQQALQWRTASPGIEWAEARLSGRGEAWRLKLVVARIDPRRVRFALDTAFTAGRERAAWGVDRAGDSARLAINAGQFPRTLPWGWVVMRGREFLAPGYGPLSTAVAIDSSGGVRWIAGDSIASRRSDRDIVTAFQSYPTLLASNGVVPPPLRSPGHGVDVEHRDARLAIGQDRSGRLIVALTRFDAAGGALDFVPFGLTTPEMAAVMGALGARDAVMLDGGISAQMMIREGSGTHRWEGLRRVPMGLIVISSSDQ